MPIPFEAKKRRFQSRLLNWGRSHGRHYPWRDPATGPYQILVAEILLKRTTATAVSRLYEVFLEKYPTLQRLANSNETQLAKDLAPIGLHNQRARAAIQLGQYLVKQESGSVPDTLERLLKVPGLGQYSARAILTFSYNVPVAVVDGNVRRILTRVFHDTFPRVQSLAAFQREADALLPRR